LVGPNKNDRSRRCHHPNHPFWPASGRAAQLRRLRRVPFIFSTWPAASMARSAQGTGPGPGSAADRSALILGSSGAAASPRSRSGPQRHILASRSAGVEGARARRHRGAPTIWTKIDGGRLRGGAACDSPRSAPGRNLVKLLDPLMSFSSYPLSMNRCAFRLCCPMATGLNSRTPAARHRHTKPGRRAQAQGTRIPRKGAAR